jgi:hypothetical protein
MTEPLEIVNVDRPFEILIVMSGVVPFVLRAWAGRRHNSALCYSPIEHPPDGDE